MRVRTVSAALSGVTVLLAMLPADGSAQFQGGLDGVAVIGARGAHGGLLAADLQMPFCNVPTECGFALGGAMHVGVASSEQAADSRVWLALGPTFSIRGFSSPQWELAVDLGGWVGGRDESLDGGYHLGVRGFVGLLLSEFVSLGLRAGVSFYGGARSWVTFQPGLALRWRVWEAL